MLPFVDLKIDGHVAIAAMSSPATRNALGSTEQYADIESVCARVSQDRGVRAMVWTGSGKAFCSGGDIKDMLVRSRDDAREAVEDRYFYKEGIHRIPAALYNLEVPIVAAVNGAAIGAGLDLACMCDIRVASTNATFAESFVKLGIIPGDGGAFLLQRIVGVAKAAELTLTGRTINASEALECDLVSKVVSADELLPCALALAREIAANPPHALRMAKRLLREAQTARLDSILELSAAFQALAHSTSDHRDSLAAAVARISTTSVAQK